MSGAAAIRAGGGYVEISARDGAFHQAMNRVQSKMRAVAQTMQRVGTGMSLAGAGLGAPLVLAARQAAAFEDALLGMQAAAGLTGAQIKKMADEAKRLSSAMGIAPETIANAFLELTKAGMSVEEVLAGAGRSAVEFADISGVDAQRAAVFMKAAMNVFGVSAQEAVDTLSAAADSSETSIQAMIESFSQVGSAGKAFDQSLFGISQAMAALAKSNVMGEEAGTAIKTMLTKLVAPTDDAQEALGRLGLSVSDFRDETGKLLPMAQIAGVFERALKGMGENAEQTMLAQQALVDVFEQRGIKVITAFANIGEKGFKDIERQMNGTLSVSEKFAISMSGISGQFKMLGSAIKRVSVAFGEAVDGPMGQFTAAIVRVLDGITKLIEANPKLATAVAASVAGLVALGTAAIAGALLIKVFGAAIAVLLNPIGAVVSELALFAWVMTDGFKDLESWGMRIQSVWRKVGIYIASAFDKNVFDNMNALLAEEDARLAKWEEKAKTKREKQGNALNPDAEREPMKGNPIARRKAAEELAKEDAEYEQQLQQAITRTSDDFFRATKEAGKFGAAGKEAFDAYFQGLAKLQQQALAGILNPTSLEQEAQRMQDVFAQIMEGLSSGQANEKQSVSSLGTFGSADQLGVGPDLADPMRSTAENTREILGVANQMLEQLRNANAPVLAAAGDAGKMAGAATRAAAGRDVALSSQNVGPAITNGLGSVTKACQDTAEAVKSSNRLLERVANKLDGLRVAYQ